MRISNESIFQWLFGSQLKRKILRFLYASQGLVSERELGRLLNVSHVAVNKAMKQLLEMNAVEYTSVGKALAWTLNKKSFTYPIIQEFMKVIDITPLNFVMRKLSLAVTRQVAEINAAHQQLKPQNAPEALIAPWIVPIHAVYVFGSVADGTARPDSDIDVLVLLEENYSAGELKEKLQREIGTKILEETGNVVSFHIYHWNEYLLNKPKWLKNAVDTGIKVY